MSFATDNQTVDKIVHFCLRLLRRFIALCVFIALVSYVRVHWMSTPEKKNWRNFSIRMFDSALSDLSRTRLGFFYEGLVGVLLAGVAFFVFLRVCFPSEDWKLHAKNSLLAIVVGLFVPSFIFLSTFAWKIATAVYDDHHDNIGRLSYVINERERLRNGLKERDDYIRRLESRTCPVCQSSKYAAPNSAPARKPSIGDGSIEARLVCSLRDPTKMPEDSLTSWAADPHSSYLEGNIGKSYLETAGQVHYRRMEEEGNVSFSQTWTLAKQSDLLGQSLSELDNYKKLTLNIYVADGTYFKSCSHVEVNFRVNGFEVFNVNEPFPPELGPLMPHYSPTLFFKLKDLRLPK